MPALLHIDEKRRVGAAVRVRCRRNDAQDYETYTDCNERNSSCSCCKEDSMILLLAAASELRLRNDDCAVSGSCFIIASSLIEAEKSATEPPSDIR